MFYSHEVLTSKKYGIATVWLVATVGSNSSLKKVNRKAILEVNVKRACETITEPAAPMALRLQGNLLYGVSRVYSQQCGYVLTDAQKAQDSMRNLLKVSKNNNLDGNAGKANPEQIMLMDDPAFDLNLTLPPLEFDLFGADNGAGESQNSLFSPNSRNSHKSRPRASSSGSSGASSVLNLRLSNSSGGGSRAGTYQLPDLDGDIFNPIGSSAQKHSGLNTKLGGRNDEEELGLEEVDWEFDDEGNEVAVRNLGAPATFREKLLSGSAASGAVRREHEEAQAARDAGVFDADGDQVMFMGDDDLGMAGQDIDLDPNAEAFPIPASAAGKSKFGNKVADEEDFEPSSDEAEAQAKKTRKPKQKKTIPADETLMLSRTEIREFHDNYLDNMKKEAEAKQARLLGKVAKTNAHTWVLGDGIGGIGRGIGDAKLASPLEIFTGKNLFRLVQGMAGAYISSPPPRSNLKRGSSLPLPDGSDGEGRRKRPRLLEGIDGDIDMDAVARGDDQFQPIFDDEGMDLEMGREGQSALEDHMSSAMPWNINASGGPRAPSSSIQGGRGFMSGSLRHSSVPRGENQYQFGSQIGNRPGSRLISASPLTGRGSNRGILPLEHGSDDNYPMLGDNNDSPNSSNPTKRNMNTQERAIEFERFGVAAQVDTQVAAQYQWVADALHKESYNFLSFVQARVEEKSKIYGKGKGVAKGDEDIVMFEDLIPTNESSLLVASQAFLHVLTLATKNMLGVNQVDQEFGHIELWLKEDGVEALGRVDVPDEDEDVPDEDEDVDAPDVDAPDKDVDMDESVEIQEEVEKEGDEDLDELTL